MFWTDFEFEYCNKKYVEYYYNYIDLEVDVINILMCE